MTTGQNCDYVHSIFFYIFPKTATTNRVQLLFEGIEYIPWVHTLTEAAMLICDLLITITLFSEYRTFMIVLYVHERT